MCNYVIAYLGEIYGFIKSIILMLTGLLKFLTSIGSLFPVVLNRNKQSDLFNNDLCYYNTGINFALTLFVLKLLEFFFVTSR